MAVRSALVTVMVRAAQKAGRGLVRDFGEVENLQVSRKGPADFVSAADMKSDQTLRDELKRARPRFGIETEESGVADGEDGEWRFIVDPLDGTTNFLHGLPQFAISIGAVKGDEPVAGVVFNPVTDELFWAEKGAGAYLNDRRLRVSGRRSLSDSVIGTGLPFMGKGDPSLVTRELDILLREVAGIRRFGAAALDLAYVAAGRFDGFWEAGLNAWDVAAGIVLIREAGGMVTEVGGGHDPLRGGTLLASNGHLHAPLDAALRKARQR